MTRHFDHVIDVNVVLSVDKLRQKVEANVHVRGKDIHAEAIEPDMYAAIDALADKLDRRSSSTRRSNRRTGWIASRSSVPSPRRNPGRQNTSPRPEAPLVTRPDR